MRITVYFEGEAIFIDGNGDNWLSLNNGNCCLSEEFLFISVHKVLIHHSVFRPFIHRTFTGHSLEEGFV